MSPWWQWHPKHTSKKKPTTILSNALIPSSIFRYIFLIFICLLKSCRPPKIFGHKTQLWGKLSHLFECVCLCGKVRLLFVRVFVLFICSFVYVCIHCLYCKYMFTFVCWFHLVNNSHTLKCTSGMMCSCANVPKEDNKNEKSFNFFSFLSFFRYPTEWLPSVCYVCVCFA